MRTQMQTHNRAQSQACTPPPHPHPHPTAADQPRRRQRGQRWGRAGTDGEGRGGRAEGGGGFADGGWLLVSVALGDGLLMNLIEVRGPGRH